MRLRTAFAFILLVGLSASSAFAQSSAAQGSAGSGRSASIQARQRMQMHRIRAARQRGTIDDAEHRRLLAMEQGIRTLTQRLRASDSRLTARERVRIHSQLNRADRAIRRAGR
jgi:hypothetical protein